MTHKCPSCNARIELDYVPSEPVEHWEDPKLGSAAICEGPEACPECGEVLDLDAIADKYEKDLGERFDLARRGE